MKVVKLNKRFNVYRNQGHIWGLRFSPYLVNMNKIQQIEHSLTNMLGSQYSSTRWRAYFGKENGRAQVYWITIKDPSVMTALLLKFDHNS